MQNQLSDTYYDETRRVLRILSYPLATQALRHPLLTQDVTEVYQPTAAPARYHPAFDAMWARNGPAHDDQKALVRDPFSARELSQLEQEMAERAASLLRAALADHPGRLEVMGDFVRPFCSGNICRVLGVDLSDAQQFVVWMDEFAAAPSFESLPEQADMIAYLRDLGP
jgi:cytochrome P450